MLALLPLSIPLALPDDPRIAYVGRFDRSDPRSIACQWSASEVRLRLQGRHLEVSIDETGRDRWQIILDGKNWAVLAPHPGRGNYRIDLGSDRVHDVRLIKRTEPSVGTTRFYSFGVPGGGLFQARRRAKTIEFVGDSITCGYGVEGANENEHFRPETENAAETYAFLTGRALDAEVRLIAWSGRKLWPDNTMPEIYDRVLPTQPTPLVVPGEEKAVAVVIALATNDFAPTNPAERDWTQAYEGFIRKIWTKYPEAHVYIALGGMMTDDWPPKTFALTTARGYLTRLVERMHESRLHFVEFETQKPTDGIGSDWHPNRVTHRKMAARLAEAMRKDLGL